MKVNHHGSASSTNDLFVHTLHPTVAIIDVGTSSHRHPTQDALDRLRGHCVVYQTELGNGGTLPTGCVFVSNGGIKLTTDGVQTFVVQYGPYAEHPYRVE